MSHPCLSDVEISFGPPDPLDPGIGSRASEPLASPTAVLLAIRRRERVIGYVAVPGEVARHLTRHLIGNGPDELDGPRAATWVERGAVAFAACALVGARDCRHITVDPIAPNQQPDIGLEGRACIPITVRIAGVRHEATLFAAEAPTLRAPALRPLAELLAWRGEWLAGTAIAGSVVIDAGQIGLSQLAALGVGDVIVPPGAAAGVAAGDLPTHWPAHWPARMQIGRGGFAVELDSDRGVVTLQGGYQRGERAMSEMTADDLLVDLSCRVGRVSMSARQVLDLSVGQVLTLDRPLGGPVDILCGDRSIGRGELIDVEGELGVRVLSLAEPKRGDQPE